MSLTEDDAERKRAVLREVLEALMSGKLGVVSRHFAPGVMFSNRSNAGVIDGPWFGRLEGDFRLAGEAETRSFLNELMQKAKYISYEERGLVIEQDSAASLCNWMRRNEKDGTLVSGTTMWWFFFTSDSRIRYVESISSIHSVLPAREREAAEA
ncbi:nuclear transport factor 2 family protein [Aureimonas psammosilenae]|uniref:nuclear transport factor 2 family protein n=1 Tax=Aureimonas psammosilenae TaxID=2495496 RepID=UPI001260CDA6|nr:nuclear transport factor 2 family protein [Aureimonas psammosilenae]